MYITNAGEIIPLLRSKLVDYLLLMKVIGPGQKKMLCPFHNDNNPSMVLNPKANNDVAHCFTCGSNMDIFAAANKYENLPESGPEWMTKTIPALAEKFDLSIDYNELSSYSREKLKLYKLVQDITDIIESPKYRATEYSTERNWTNDIQVAGSISEEELINCLVAKNWSLQDINSSLIVRTSNQSFFGTEKVTFSIRDPHGKPIAFISRNLNEGHPKYLNTIETPIYEKRKTLLGLNIALKTAKSDGLFIVEGPGDLQQLYRLGIKNATAVCGTAVTGEHLNILKVLGIKNIYLCLDWDQAGAIATNRIFEDALKNCPGISCWVVEAPPNTTTNLDPDSYLKDKTDPEAFRSLTKTSAFEWVMRNSSDNNSPDIICTRMIPIIATEPAAVKRELLIKKLQEYTGISYQSIYNDVLTIRDGTIQERRERLLAATDKYRAEVESNPDDLAAAMAQHEADISDIEHDYENDLVGVGYQLSRYDAIQELKASDEYDIDQATFAMSYFTDLAKVLNGGMTYSQGTLMYIGGRANSGKTAVCILIGLDVCLTDPNAIVIIHSTDDSYIKIEPRLRTNISYMLDPKGPELTIGMAASPRFNIYDDSLWAKYKFSDQKLRELIYNEKLIIIDSEDGPTLSVLERTIRYIRRKYPSKKILCICDNTHNYQSFSQLDPTGRMTQISNGQKLLTAKYKICMIATVEYRKNMPIDQSKLKLPVNDDIADARALMYRADVIIHVYNDLNDRGDSAEFFWIDPLDPSDPRPRLNLIFGKNKISSFKKSLALDLNPVNVTLRQVSTERKKEEYENYVNNEGLKIINGKLILEVPEWNTDQANA